MSGRISLAGLIVLGGCAAAPAPPAPAVAAPPANPPAATVVTPEGPPKLRLPGDTRPTAETLALQIDPKEERFSGVADITISLEHPRSVVWLHGQGLHVTRATVAPEGGSAVVATWEEREGTRGTVSLTVPDPLPAGRAVVHVEYDAPFGHKLEGLFKLTETGAPYAFTQFENIAAREAFPCFDEPGFKIPWDVTLVVPKGQEAVANTPAVSRDEAGTWSRIHFSPTAPLPSYLVAFAVGPLDLVNGPDVPSNAVRKDPLPLRGVATRGNGKALEYTLAHAGEIVGKLEAYFGIAYPFQKLDLIAVPDMSGAMENAAAVTFNAGYLLLGDGKTLTVRQKHDFAVYVSHELAHQWVGDLVTAAWWDDIWLNEAFATWLEAKISDAWDPETGATTELVAAAERAMETDALVSARAVRQPITSTDDIENAFDEITYEKGAAVLRMFEQWVGTHTFQLALRDYLTRHRFGSATADDFLDALSLAAQKDVKAPFHTFLDHPGVPYVAASLRCDGVHPAELHLTTTRYLPRGSTGDATATWQLPFCARYGYDGRKESYASCELLTRPETDLPLPPRCPDWVMPNADAMGYFQFSLASDDLERLRTKGLASLPTHERMALGSSLRAGLARGTLSMKDAILSASALATDPHPNVAGVVMGLVSQARDWLYRDPTRPRVEAYARKLFQSEARELGWQAGKNDNADRIDLRARVLRFLATTGQDPAVRAEAKRRGAAVGDRTDLGALELATVAEDATPAVWEKMRAQVGDPAFATVRVRLLQAIAGTRRPELAVEVREMTLAGTLRSSELLLPLYVQMGHPETRDAAWEWMKEHWTKLAEVVPKDIHSELIAMTGAFCDEAHVKDLEAFFTPTRVGEIDGGPRVLASAIESVHLCALQRAQEEPTVRAFFKSL